MSLRNASGPLDRAPQALPERGRDLSVQVPPPSADRPSWTKVGVITAIGFSVGVAWPRIAGVRLGPSVPETSSETAAAAAPSSSAETAAAGTGASAEPAAVASIASPVPAPSALPGPTIAVGHGTVVACKG